MGGRIARLTIQLWDGDPWQDGSLAGWREKAEVVIADPREADRMTFRLEGRTIIVEGLIKEVQEQLERYQ